MEGGIENVDWAQAAREGKVPPCGSACEHFSRYEEDFDLAKQLGHTAHRLSLEWARIEPQEGVFDHEAIAHYKRVLRALRARGIEPFVTLWHFTLPLWFVKKGGFLAKESPAIFQRYARFVGKELGADARFWITINEPLIWSSNAYMRGKWPPFAKNSLSYFLVIEHLIAAHRLSYDALHESALGVSVGVAKNNIFFRAGWNPFWKIVVVFADWFWNRRFLNRINDKQDFIGLNHYFYKPLGMPRSLERTDTNWDIFPASLFVCLKRLAVYKKPIYITENGLADAQDTKRARYIERYLEATLQALKEGVDVRGYFYWSLLDNYEWKKGFHPRFGLIAVDYATQARSIRPSALRYKEIIESNSL